MLRNKSFVLLYRLVFVSSFELKIIFLFYKHWFIVLCTSAPISGCYSLTCVKLMIPLTANVCGWFYYNIYMFRVI